MFSRVPTINAEAAGLPTDAQLLADLQSYSDAGKFPALIPAWTDPKTALQQANRAVEKADAILSSEMLSNPDLMGFTLHATTVNQRTATDSPKRDSLGVVVFERGEEKYAGVVCNLQHYGSGGLIFDGPNPFEPAAERGALRKWTLGVG